MKYYLATDNDCHWYVIPLTKRKEWDEWCEIPSDDERAWEPPEFAVPVNGDPGQVVFKEYKIL